MQVGLVPGRGLDGRRLHFDEILGLEPAADESGCPRPRDEFERAARRIDLGSKMAGKRLNSRDRTGKSRELRAIPSGL